MSKIKSIGSVLITILLTSALLAGCATIPKETSSNKISQYFPIRRFNKTSNMVIKDNKIIKYNSKGKKIAEFNLKNLGIPDKYVGFTNGGGILNIHWKNIALGVNNDILAAGCAIAFVPHAFGRPSSAVDLGIIEELSDSGKFIKSVYIPMKAQYYPCESFFASFNRQN